MAQKSEYKAISASSAPDLTKKLVADAMVGWKPILITSTAVEKGLTPIITVILEHEM